jgi:hypothetical protein
MMNLVRSFFAKKVIAEPVAAESYVFDPTRVKTLLERDWFVDDDSLLEFFEDMDEDEYNYAKANRDKYSRRIRECIDFCEEFENPAPKPKLSLRISEMSEREMTRYCRKRDGALQDSIEKVWILHKTSNSLSRPKQDFDHELLAAEKNLEFAQNTKKNYRAPYVPRGMTSTRNTVEEKINADVSTLEQKVNSLKSQIEIADKDWETVEREKFLHSHFNI